MNETIKVCLMLNKLNDPWTHKTIEGGYEINDQYCMTLIKKLIVPKLCIRFV